MVEQMLTLSISVLFLVYVHAKNVCVKMACKGQNVELPENMRAFKSVIDAVLVGTTHIPFSG
jgi:hypothetical protein